MNNHSGLANSFNIDCTRTHTQGHLLSPGQGSSLCDPIAAVNVNLSLIAYVNTFYNECPFVIENNIYEAGYAAMIVYTPDPNSNFDPATDLPQAMFSRLVSRCSKTCSFCSNYFTGRSRLS